MNGNGKDPSADAVFPTGIEEDEDDFDFVGENAQFDGNDELLPPGFSAASDPLNSTLGELGATSDVNPAGPAPGAVAALDEDTASARPATRPAEEARARESKESKHDKASSEPRTAEAVRTRQTADALDTPQAAARPRPRRRWLVGVLITAILACAGSLGYAQWPFGNPVPALISFVTSKSEIATASAEVPAAQSLPSSPQSLPAAQSLPGDPSTEIFNGQPNLIDEQPNALGENLQAFQQNGTGDVIGAFPSDGSAPFDVMAAQLLEYYEQDTEVLAMAVEQMEGLESLLMGLHERLDHLEKNQRELEDAARTDSGSPKSPPAMDNSVDVVAEKPSELIAARVPLRADIGKCGAEGRSVIESLGRMQMAAHEGADGRRWIRILGPHWRRDLTSGDRLPVGSPGEARVWVDGAGVFGVVSLPGRAPCRVEWK